MVMEAEQNDKIRVWEEKEKLVTFIAGVINTAYEVQSKTERIQIIIKAEVHHLDIIGLKWEKVIDNLVLQPSRKSRIV